jgi:hypothetical protein
MSTECTPRQLEFQGFGRRQVVARFDGGSISSDGGGLLLREVDRRARILQRFAGCFVDHRRPELIEHSVAELVSQRIYGLALGYEDLNDHDELRWDPLLGVLVGKSDPQGLKRARERDRGKALAGKSTLNRLELTPAETGPGARYKKVAVRPEGIDELLVTLFIEAHEQPPQQIVLDVDATDDPLHGEQEGRFFHGYYRHYCYLPLYVFCGEHLLCARLRPSNIDASAGTVEELERIIGRIRSSWPEVKILVRGDSGFCREKLMSWCEANGIDYVLGIAKNKRLKASIADELAAAEALHEQTGRAARVFKDFRYRTLNSWSRERRVVGKAEHLYCARGDMENRIKEQQLALFADRTSTATMRANQLRLYFSSIAYVLLHTLRRVGLAGTELAKAQCDTIRLKLLKIGALIRITVRKVWVSLSQSCPYADLFWRAYERLRSQPLRC